MYELFDQFSWTKQNKTITRDRHQVPALGNFTYWSYTVSPAPCPMHYHSNILEIHCMIKGKRYSQIEKEGVINNYIYTGNEAFLTFPFEIHGNGNQPQSPCEFYAFQIMTHNPDEMLGLNKKYSNTLCRELLTLKHRHLRLGHSHLQYLRTAFTFFSDMTASSIQVGIQFLTCFLFSLQYLTPIMDSQIKAINEGIHQSITYLNQNIREPLSLRDLADASGYSLSRFKVKFKDEVGITPAEYITLQKLEYAKKELTQTNISITDLAYSLGFSSSNYFSSVFKKMMDYTPKDYRNHFSSLASKNKKSF
ncbi:AraC-like DNA-binding protein [Anaerobacterium chartisolvens]|uniref:AraC-like DNA-binding protein n=1 Tax=Anaerobacterium chartisolvens TaxID=1297424 RepID=A0A369BCS0_9FIRM|nr:helix-turn-helix transcriptional regulator [Anaerobacterium chartisolvens]RCX19352.1 AraC-like DNA-binding protein [Anaerobacterium chartisolvens]